MSKTILITGASSGIGKATAKLFHERGWNVIATMRRPEEERELNRLERTLITRLDVTDASSIRAAVKNGVDRFGMIDVLLNNAGYGVFGPLEATPIEKIKEQFETNVFGLLAMTKALLPTFRARREGIIVNVSSLAGKVTFPLAALYHGTKFAVEGLSEALSFELAEIGVKMKLVEPGAVKTRFKFDVTNDESIAEYQPMVRGLEEFMELAMTKGSEPAEVAEVIYLAATDGTNQLRYVSGKDAEELIARRKVEEDSVFLGRMRSMKLGAA
jgi:NAD(P)-dependent dehydrogenase (short-subunit alcohol dehydrogenase family)